MLGKQSSQRGLWEADSLYIDHMGRRSLRPETVATESESPCRPRGGSRSRRYRRSPVSRRLRTGP